MITDVEDYFADGCGRCLRFGTDDCASRIWSVEQAELRSICLEAGLSETAKWGHPCYMHAGRNIAIMGAFRGDVRLTLFNAALLRDPGGLLVRQGANTRQPDAFRFTDPAQIGPIRPQILAYLREAMGYAAAGILPEKTPHALDIPDELAEAMDADSELAEAFHALTPGRQRSYAINLGGAKKPETRIARIEKFRPAILAGKGANER
ncbi:MAG: YdeI/OmpD-associated family protein [Paracoccus sp. (in: a-proteobacteria)]